jgi:hypothetical protein
MMDQFYGVVASEVLHTKGYSYFVQQAGSTISVQLRVSNADAKIQSPNSGFTSNPFIYPRPSLWTSEHEQCSPSLKPENYSGSPEHYCYSGLAEHKHCLGLKNEKGRTANPTLWGIYSSNYETFVVHTSTYTKSVGQSSGDSLAFLRCLRLISPSSAVTMNCAVLSFSSFVCSTACATSCGTRALIFCDLLLILFGGITDLRIDLWVPVYTKYNCEKALKWVPLGVYSGCQLDVDTFNVGEALTDCTPYRASIHNVTETYTMALQHSTQTRPEKKYLWRFLALNRSDMCAKPCRISVEAPTEHDARRVLAPFFILSLSARLSAQGVSNA